MTSHFLARQGVDRTAWLLALIAIAAYAPGIWWGLPHATSEVGKHGWDVDGVAGILTLSELHNLFVEGKPDWYVAYPPLHYLLLGAVYSPYLGGLWMTGGFANPTAGYPYGFTDPVTAVATLALLGRLVTLLMASGIVAVAYLTAKTVWDRTTGILAAFAAMLAQPMFYYSRTSNLDVPVLFWLSLSILTAARMISVGVTIRRGAWLGTFIALTVATKDQGYGPWAVGLLALPFLCSSGAPGQGRQWIWRPWLALVVAAIGVYLVAGGLLLSPHRFAAHVRYVAGFKQTFPIVQQSPEILRPLTPEGGLILAAENLEAVFEAVGPLLPVVGLAGFIVGRRSRFLQLVAATVLGHIMFVLIPVQHVQYRYVMFLAYALAFPAAWLLARGFERHRPIRALAAALGVIAGAHLGVRAIDLTYQMIFDARREAGAWLAVHARPGTGLTYFGLVDQLPRLPAGTDVWRTSADDPVETQWSQRSPDFVLVIPDFSSAPGMVRSRFLPEPVYERLQNGLLGYREVARFTTQPLLNRPLKYLPYVNSPVRIYARRDVFTTGNRPPVHPAPR